MIGDDFASPCHLQRRLAWLVSSWAWVQQCGRPMLGTCSDESCGAETRFVSRKVLSCDISREMFDPEMPFSNTKNPHDEAWLQPSVASTEHHYQFGTPTHDPPIPVQVGSMSRTPITTVHMLLPLRSLGDFHRAISSSKRNTENQKPQKVSIIQLVFWLLLVIWRVFKAKAMNCWLLLVIIDHSTPVF